MNLKEKARSLPMKPGVYIMKDSMGNIIYIGKSKHLKNRVSQYFQRNSNHPPKIVRMIKNIDHFEYILTDTELDALLLECSLIKKHKPMYNSQMKNEKAYPYIKLTTSEEYPRLITTYDEELDDGIYFGPYTSLSTAEKIKSFIEEMFPIRRCSLSDMSKNNSGCLNYHLGLCMGCCRDDVNKDMYLEYIEKTVQILEGKNGSFLTETEKKMKEAAKQMDFHRAAKLKKNVDVIKHINSIQSMVKHTQKRRRIVALEYIDESNVKLFLIRGNKILYKRIMKVMKYTKLEVEDIIKVLVYEHFSHDNESNYKLTREDVDEGNIIYSYLKNKKIKHITVAKSWLRGPNEDKVGKAISKLLLDIEL